MGIRRLASAASAKDDQTTAGTPPYLNGKKFKKRLLVFKKNFMYYVYILRSSEYSEEIYTGYTEWKPEVRLKDHNAGYSKHTNKYKPWKIVRYGAFNEKKAIEFECI